MQAGPISSASLSVLSALRDRYGAEFARGRTIVREGEPDTDLFVILEGRVEYSVRESGTGTKRVIGVGGPGEIFGEVSCFTGKPRVATALALEDVVVLKFDHDAAVDLVRTSSDFALRIIHLLAERLHTDATIVASAARP